MVKSKGLSWQVGAAYIGTVIGAGFASGQEIMQFFTRYGSVGVILLFFTGVLFSLCGYAVFYMAKKYNTYDYNSFIIRVCGPRISIVYDCIITMFLFFGASIMFSGGGAIFVESFQVSKLIGVIIIAVLTLLVVLKSVEGILKINTVVMPILICVIFYVLLKTLAAGSIANFTANAASIYKGDLIRPIFSFIFYCSYNLVLSLGVLSAFPQDIDSLKTLKRGAFLGGFGLMALSMALNICLILYVPAILKLSIPVLYIGSMHGIYIKYAILLCIWFEIGTTAIANVFSLAKRLVKNRPKLYKPVSLFIVVACIPMALLDFKKLISFFYPLFGALSMFLLGMILIQFIRLRILGKVS